MPELNIGNLRLSDEEVSQILYDFHNHKPGSLPIVDAQLAKALWGASDLIENITARDTFEENGIDYAVGIFRDLLQADGIPRPTEAQYDAG